MTATTRPGQSDSRRHWQETYTGSTAEKVSWYQRTPRVSLDLIAACGVGPDARIIDVGGGASTLVDHLLALGHENLTVLDVARTSLDIARARLGADAARITWIEADITAWRPPHRYDLWHDRAVFHFLTRTADRAAYRRALEDALAPGGHAIIATFSPEGPEKCSGLPVVRYSPETLARALGAGLALRESVEERHITPAGRSQAFVYCRFARL